MLYIAFQFWSCEEVIFCHFCHVKEKSVQSCVESQNKTIGYNLQLDRAHGSTIHVFCSIASPSRFLISSRESDSISAYV